MYRLFSIKRYLEQFVMFPFIVLGRIIARITPLKEDFDVFFFFPGFTIGGAERVNAEIVKSFSDKKVIIFFTKYSANRGMRHFFEQPNVTLKEVNKWTDNKIIYFCNFIFRGICSEYINRNKTQTVVFIGQCNFGYKLTPHINRKIRIHELIHMYDPKFVWVWAPFIRFIDTRIVVGKIFLEKFKACYHEFGIPEEFLDRLRIIFYRLEYLPSEFHKRRFDLPLKVYYAGRGGPQKRVWLIVEIIKRCREINLPVEFSLAGSFKNELPESLILDKTYKGELQGGEEMYNFHKANDVLLMTSAWEGFPLVIMEAMAFGAIPVVSEIDAIPEHISHKVNGYLLQQAGNERAIIEEAIQILQELVKNTHSLIDVSHAAYQYALNTFSSEKFEKEYRNVLLGE